MLHIYDSLEQTKKEFKPLKPGKVGIYVCGVTVYDACHLGHARTYVAFDVVHRYFKALGYQVNFVRNVTDVDDKIIVRAQERQISEKQLTDEMTAAMHRDFDALYILPVTQEPRAMDHIQHMLDLIQRLFSMGGAYQGDNGDVYFDVGFDEDYGALSHQDLEALKSGARVDVDTNKKNPLDFVLWKMAKPDEPAWDSPWGKGRPGWHIECSAMAMKYLGESFDIHGGGRDLLFPHHENERAQSEQVSGQKFVEHWMHAGYLEVDSVKMSKSLGNFLTIQDALAQYHPEVLRCFLISSHYRSPMVYSEQNLKNAERTLDKLYQGVRGWVSGDLNDRTTDFSAALGSVLSDELQGWVQKFRAALDDDFNTPLALSVLFELLKQVNKLKPHDPEGARVWATTLRGLAQILGILHFDPEVFLRAKNESIDAGWVHAKIAERDQARVQKNWAQADRVRQELEEKGVILEDGPNGTIWRV